MATNECMHSGMCDFLPDDMKVKRGVESQKKIQTFFPIEVLKCIYFALFLLTHHRHVSPLL